VVPSFDTFLPSIQNSRYFRSMPRLIAVILYVDFAMLSFFSVGTLAAFPSHFGLRTRAMRSAATLADIASTGSSVPATFGHLSGS